MDILKVIAIGLASFSAGYSLRGILESFKN